MYLYTVVAGKVATLSPVHKPKFFICLVDPCSREYPYCLVGAATARHWLLSCCGCTVCWRRGLCSGRQWQNMSVLVLICLFSDPDNFEPLRTVCWIIQCICCILVVVPRSAPRNMHVYDPTTNTLSVSWEHAVGPVQQYRISYAPTTGDPIEEFVSLNM